MTDETSDDQIESHESLIVAQTRPDPITMILGMGPITDVSISSSKCQNGHPSIVIRVAGETITSPLLGIAEGIDILEHALKVLRDENVLDSIVEVSE